MALGANPARPRHRARDVRGHHGSDEALHAVRSRTRPSCVSQLSAALAGVKSCTFDLGSGHDQGATPSSLDKASVSNGGSAVPLDPAPTGGTMSSDTGASAFGTACDKWRESDANDIKFNFPCEIIVDAATVGRRGQPRNPTTRLTAVASMVVL